jgi:hypothetical protein
LASTAALSSRGGVYLIPTVTIALGMYRGGAIAVDIQYLQ